MPRTPRQPNPPAPMITGAYAFDGSAIIVSE
jgi:hypothetical protein